jgi:DNA-binding beta-propeller fold protein YncE
VSVINGRTRAVMATVPGVDDPVGAAANPLTNIIYVTNFADNTVSVLASWQTLGGATASGSALAAGKDDPQADVRRAVDKQRAALGLPPVTDELAVVLAAAAFPEAVQAALPARAVCG